MYPVTIEDFDLSDDYLVRCDLRQVKMNETQYMITFI